VEIGLVLFLITVIINGLSRFLIWRMVRVRPTRVVAPVKVPLAA